MHVNENIMFYLAVCDRVRLAMESTSTLGSRWAVFRCLTGLGLSTSLGDGERLRVRRAGSGVVLRSGSGVDLRSAAARGFGVLGCTVTCAGGSTCLA